MFLPLYLFSSFGLSFFLSCKRLLLIIFLFSPWASFYLVCFNPPPRTCCFHHYRLVSELVQLSSPYLSDSFQSIIPVCRRLELFKENRMIDSEPIRISAPREVQQNPGLLHLKFSSAYASFYLDSLMLAFSFVGLKWQQRQSGRNSWVTLENRQLWKIPAW